MRHPFPGPGLAIRILGEITRSQVKIAQHADQIFIEEIRKAGLYDQISQAFAALLPVKAVGVQGDRRTYEQVSFDYYLSLTCLESANGLSRFRLSVSERSRPKIS